MTETEKYVRRYLKEELWAVQSSGIASVKNGLDIYEKTLIFYYTGSGYRTINASLRRSGGTRSNRAAELLQKAIARLPDISGPVFRSCHLTKKQIAEYARCAETESLRSEPTFLSTSRNEEKLEHYPNTNCRFVIYARHGKVIEECSRFGINMPPNEEEILFLPGSVFRVLDVNDSEQDLLIMMEEI